MKTHDLREPVRVLMHLNEGYTKVIVEQSEGNGMADSGITWDIPTAAIPPHLRMIGCRFVVNTQVMVPEEGDTIESLRAACSGITVEEAADTGGIDFTTDSDSPYTRP